MIVKVRATREEDKLARRGEILDAAERLFQGRPEGLASMDELGEAAGVAKGTLYLYFAGKEEVLVGLHERFHAAFFDQLMARLASKRRFTLEDLLDLTRKEMLDHPERLSLASLVIGLTERSLSPEAALRFKMALGERVLEAGRELDRALGLASGDGVRLLNVSYGLMIGMWQLKGCMVTERYQHLLDPKIAKAFLTEYPVETIGALRLLWNAAIEAARSRKRPARRSA